MTQQTFSEREIAALPEHLSTAVRMLVAGCSPREVRAATGMFIYQQKGLLEDAREILNEHSIEELEADNAQCRQGREALAALGVLPNLTRNCLVRNGVLTGAQVCAMTDAELLSLRNFGVTNLRYARQHFPYLIPEPPPPPVAPVIAGGDGADILGRPVVPGQRGQQPPQGQNGRQNAAAVTNGRAR